MRNRMIVLGLLLSATAAAALHPAAAANIVPHWELYMFLDIDGKRAGVERLDAVDYKDALSCITAATKQPPLPPSKVVNGHTYTLGYNCHLNDGTPEQAPVAPKALPKGSVQL